MGLTEKQREILDFANKNEGKITKKEAIILIGASYYCNSAKHVGDVLSRMVNSGLLTREKPGKFKVGKGKAVKKVNIVPNQTSLFQP